MRSAEPYLFDRSFDAELPDAPPLSASPSEGLSPGEPVYTGEDLQRARAEGVALGRAEAIAEHEIEREGERRRQDTLAAVADRLTELLARSAQARGGSEP